MKQLLLICAVMALVGGCASPNWVYDPSDPINVMIGKAIRYQLKKPTGEIIKADLEKVGMLNLQRNQLTEVPKELEKLTELWALDLSYNNLSNVKELEKSDHRSSSFSNLTQLKRLDLNDNKLTSVKGLENLTKLEWLFLDDNQLTNVKGLEKLVKLGRLDLYDNPDLTKAQIDQLQKALPKCRIGSNPTK